MAGVYEHHVALRKFDTLPLQRSLQILRGNNSSDRKALYVLETRHVDKDTACYEYSSVFNA